MCIRDSKTGNPRFAWDSYRRFVQMYGDVVLGMKPVNKEDVDPFEAIIEAVSYTHLDVYKRQDLHCAAADIFPFAPSVVFRHIDGALYGGLVCGVQPGAGADYPRGPRG